MSVSIRDARQSAEDRQWIRGVYPAYLEDLSMLNTGIFPVMGEFGEREPDLLARWFADDRSHPLLILKEGKPAGFALVVRPQARVSGMKPAPDYHLSEFFIDPRYRRLGVGREAATIIFNRFSGQWEVTEYMRNTGAVAFWRRVLAAYAAGQYTERVADGEVHQFFRSMTRAPARD
jgi:predicted acetyltransferase